MKLKILSYNIHKGFDWNNRNYFLHEIKELISSSEADLVFLQEVIGENEQYRKSGLVDSQFEFLADSVWEHYAYAKNSVYDHGHHGNLILSKYPITGWENIDVSTNRFEQRGLLISQIEVPGFHPEKFFAVCAHLDLLHRGRRLQYEMIKGKLASLNLPDHTPLIIAGDFNDWNRQATDIFEGELGMTEAHRGHKNFFARTFPAKLPLLSLDRIYVKNLNVVDSGIWPSPTGQHFSDHLPLFCEVESAY
jgi:endonuclease/exonuclease/phosphatase family metal-dependent hydrolase